jgi:hypothetical protein
MMCYCADAMRIGALCMYGCVTTGATRHPQPNSLFIITYIMYNLIMYYVQTLYYTFKSCLLLQ